MTSKIHRVNWLLLADGVGAKLYELALNPLTIAAVADGEFHGIKSMTRDLESDRPGVSFESVGGARHSIERHSNAHRREKEKFAARVAAYINEATTHKRFDQLVVVAPPRALADLRENFSAAVHGRVLKEIHGEWTKLKKDDVLDHLKHHMELVRCQ